MRLQPLFDLQGRHALVTGGASVIGEAMACALGWARATVLLVSRHEAELAATAKRLRDDELINAHWRAADLTDPGRLHDVAARAQQRPGGIDILVNAAGVNLREPFGEVTPPLVASLQPTAASGVSGCPSESSTSPMVFTGFVSSSSPSITSTIAGSCQSTP